MSQKIVCMASYKLNYAEILNRFLLYYTFTTPEYILLPYVSTINLGYVTSQETISICASSCDNTLDCCIFIGEGIYMFTW